MELEICSRLHSDSPSKRLATDDLDVGILSLIFAPEQIERAGAREKERNVVSYQTLEARTFVRRALAQMRSASITDELARNGRQMTPDFP